MRFGIATLSGILSLIAACITIIRGAISLDGGIMELPSYNPGGITSSSGINPGVSGMLFYGGIVAVLAFVFGLLGGISALRKNHVAIVIIGFALLIVESLSLLLFDIEFGAWVIFAQFGLPVLLMSIIGAVLTGIRKSEFK